MPKTKKTTKFMIGIKARMLGLLRLHSYGKLLAYAFCLGQGQGCQLVSCLD